MCVYVFGKVPSLPSLSNTFTVSVPVPLPYHPHCIIGLPWDLRSRYLYIAPPKEWQNQPNLASTPQDTPQVTPQVIRLLKALGKEERSKQEMMKMLALTDTKNFKESYLQPALQLGLIEMTIPNKPTSRNQKYRRTGKELNL